MPSMKELVGSSMSRAVVTTNSKLELVSVTSMSHVQVHNSVNLHPITHLRQPHSVKPLPTFSGSRDYVILLHGDGKGVTAARELACDGTFGSNPTILDCETLQGSTAALQRELFSCRTYSGVRPADLVCLHFATSLETCKERKSSMPWKIWSRREELNHLRDVRRRIVYICPFD